MMLQKVEAVLAQRIRPKLNSHGGDIELVELKNDTLTLRLLGACVTCPGNQQTLSEVIEASLKEECPNLKEVKVLFGVSNDLIQEALKILRTNKDS